MADVTGLNDVQVSQKYKMLRLIDYCNTQLYNPTEYTIARAILDVAESGQTVSLSGLAEKANISEASVSRFIRKCGFDSFQEFRDTYQISLVELKMGRKIRAMSQYKTREDEKLVKLLGERLKENLAVTVESVSPEDLRAMVNLLLGASSVTFIGDDHTLSDFYTLQLDILSAGIPAFLFKNREFQVIHAGTLKKGDLVVYLNVCLDFMTAAESRMLGELKKNGVTLAGLFQETTPAQEKQFDLILKFGIEESRNDGFVSLWYMSRILSEMFSASL